MTEHHDSKDTDSKDTPTTPQENASENAAPDTFDYVVDYWDDEGSASNDSSDAVIEALSATVDANATDPTDGDTDADGEPAADKSRETAPAHSNENAQVTVPDVVQVADHHLGGTTEQFYTASSLLMRLFLFLRLPAPLP